MASIVLVENYPISEQGYFEEFVYSFDTLEDVLRYILKENKDTYQVYINDILFE